MVNVRIDLNGKIRNSKPCPFCQNLLKFLDFREVWFTNDSGGFEKYKH
jgi:hypothetical protein